MAVRNIVAAAIAAVAVAATGCGNVQSTDEPAGIDVTGEEDSGRAHPVWLWTPPEDAFEQRVRLVDLGTGDDAVPWQPLGATASRWSPSDGVTAGAFRFEVEALASGGEVVAAGAFKTAVTFHGGSGPWAGVRRPRHVTTLGHEVMIACDPCGGEDVATTLTKIHTAQGQGVDAVALAVSARDGAWYVGATGGAPLATVLADEPLRRGDQLLILDLGSAAPAESDLRGLIELLRAARQSINGRPTLLRAAADLTGATPKAPPALTLLAGLVTDETQPFVVPYLRFHVGVPEADPINPLFTLIDDLARRAAGHPAWRGVDLDLGARSMSGPAAFARSKGLAVGVRPVATPAHCAAFRESVDMIASADAGTDCATAVTRTQSLVYLDASPQTKALVSYQVAAETRTFMASTSTAPVAGAPRLLIDGINEDRFGGSLLFEAGKDHRLATAPVSADGYLVSVVINADELKLAPAPAEDVVRAIVSNVSGKTGFALEQVQLAGSTAWTLRFRAFVDGQPLTATRAAPDLNDNDSLIVVGTYAPGAAARLWVGAAEGKASATSPKGATRSTEPVTLGAQPAALAATRWLGKIQTVHVDRWPPQ